jgi:hypothetical protein
MKSKILYRISFWYGIISLVFFLIAIPNLYWVYQTQGISWADLIQVLSTNTFFQNIVWFCNMTDGIFYNALIVLVSLSLIRGKTKTNRVTDVAAGIICVAACCAAVNFTVNIFSFAITRSVQESLAMMHQVAAFSEPVVPIVALIAVALLTVLYVNEKLDASPKRYFYIIFPLIALLIVILHSISRAFHLF